MSYRDQSGALEAIADRRASWIAAINGGDADAFASVLTADVVWLPWRHAAISGKDRVRDWLAGPFAEFTYDYSVADVRVRLAGDWAVERARFTTHARTRAGAPTPTHEGTYTLLWRCTPSGGWLIERYIDQTELDAG